MDKQVMTNEQAIKIAQITAQMMNLRDDLEDMQANRLLPKRLNTRTNSWLTDANELLEQILDETDVSVGDQLVNIAQKYRELCDKLEVVF